MDTDDYSPCLVPVDPEQRLDIKCAHCGKKIDFRKGEVFINGPSYVCSDHVAKPKVNLKAGCYYWRQHIRCLDPWIVCYIFQDADNNLWLQDIAYFRKPKLLSKINLNNFKWVLIKRPRS